MLIYRKIHLFIEKDINIENNTKIQILHEIYKNTQE